MPPNKSLDGENLSLGKQQTFHTPRADKTIHPSTLGYSRRTDFSSTDTPEDVINNVAETVDAMGGTLELIHECVKGTDQLINDMYERQVNLGDDLEDTKELTKSMSTRLYKMETEINELKAGQKEVKDNLIYLTKHILEMHDWLKTLRFGE